MEKDKTVKPVEAVKSAPVNEEEVNGTIDGKQIVNDAKAIDEILSSMSEEEQADFLKQAFAKYGISEEGMEALHTEFSTFAQQARAIGGDLQLPVSQFFKNVGWLPIEQALKRIDATYPLSELFPMKLVKNGTKLVFYTDFSDSDNLPAYKLPADYVGTLYNADNSIVAEEQYNVFLDVHKGLKMPSISLNDFTSDSAIFLALMSNVAYQVARPIAKKMYQLRLQMLQDASNVKEGLDWNELTIDKKITFQSGLEDVLVQLKDYIDKLGQVSRTNIPDRWKVIGLDKNLEVSLDMNDYVLIMPNTLKNAIDVTLKAGRFHEKYLNVFPEILALDYKASFGDYIAATNIKDQLSDTVAFLVPKGKQEIIYQYDGSRSQPLLTFHDVLHRYVRVGYAWDKTQPIIAIQIKLAD